jgi:uncharacterized protein YjiS (DUF1127 family)
MPLLPMVGADGSVRDVTKIRTKRVRPQSKKDETMTQTMINAFAAFGSRLYRRHMLRQLQEMDDYLLKDIGLNRADVARIIARGR